MKHTKNIIVQLFQVIPIMLLLSSCYSEMKVKVDVIDRNSILQSKAYKSLGQQKLSNLVNNNTLLTEIKALFKQKAKEIIKEGADKGFYIAPDPVIETVSQSVSDNVMKAVSDDVNTLITDLNSNKSVDIYERLNKLFMGNPSTLFKEFASQLTSGLRKGATPLLAADKVPEFTAITFKQETSAQQQLAKIITQYGESIVNDPAASLIAMVPPKYWKKYKNNVNIINDDPNTAKKTSQNARMNKVTVRTFMGNSDIAVKMEAPGMFVVKGVRLDADAAIKASFKVLNQGIKYFAYANGIPVNSPAGSTDNTGKIVHLPEKAQNDSLRIAIENFGAIDKQDKAAFFNILFSQMAKLDPATPGLTDADVKQAIDLIQNAYNIYIKKTQD